MNASAQWLDLVRVLLALVFVVGLIFLCGIIARKSHWLKQFRGNPHQPRLGLVETMYLDAKHRLVVVKFDGKEHVLLLGSSGDLLIESRDEKHVP